MDLYLIRHGECYNSSIQYYDVEKKTMNPPLTEKRIEQATRLAARCRGVGFDAILSSDLTRALQTAERIAAAEPEEVQILPAFREIDMGEIYKESWSSYPALYAEWLLHNEDLPYPNGENGADVWNRCKPALDEILEQQYKKVAIVTHGGTIRSILCGVLGIPQQKRFYLGSPLENCSITVLNYNEAEQRFYLHVLNDSSHLAE